MIENIIEPKDYIGYNATDILSYLKKTYTGTVKKRFFLLYGPPGTGKTTLTNVIEHTESIVMHRSNASDTRKTTDIKVGDYISTGISGEKSCVVLDECDGIPKKTWKKIEEISDINNNIPIILIANDIKKIPDKILKQCIKKEIKVNRFSLLAFTRRINKEDNLGLTPEQIDDYVDRCQSYRCLKTLLKYGYSDEMVIPQSKNEQILTAMHGNLTGFKPGDLRDIITIYHDNTKNVELISQVDMWLYRYEHGYGYGYRIVDACLNAIRVKKEKLDYPRTYILIHKAKGNKSTNSSTSKKKMPNIAVTGFKN